MEARKAVVEAEEKAVVEVEAVAEEVRAVAVPGVEATEVAARGAEESRVAMMVVAARVGMRRRTTPPCIQCMANWP